MIESRAIDEMSLPGFISALPTGPFHSRYPRKKTGFGIRDSRFEIRDQASRLGTDDPVFNSRFSNFVSRISPSMQALEKETAPAPPKTSLVTNPGPV